MRAGTSMGLSTRIQKLEVVAAPIKAEQERRRKAAEFRELIFRERKGFIQQVLDGYRYVLGDALDEEETMKDIIELDLTYHKQAVNRFGVDESNRFKATPEQLNDLTREILRPFNVRFYGNHQTVEQYDKTQEQWKQIRADMAAGVPSAESEAAEYLRQLFKRYPRRRDAKRFYDIWE
jgi:hypothetical protein